MATDREIESGRFPYVFQGYSNEERLADFRFRGLVNVVDTHHIETSAYHVWRCSLINWSLA